MATSQVRILITHRLFLLRSISDRRTTTIGQETSIREVEGNRCPGNSSNPRKKILLPRRRQRIVALVVVARKEMRKLTSWSVRRV